MKIEEQREYSATKILGWELKANTTSCLPYYGGPHGRTPVLGWHPDTDRNQLWLVLKEFLAWRSAFQPHAVSKPHPVIERIADTVGPIVGVIHGSHTTKQHLYQAAMESPALALKAIVKAHQEAE